MNVEEDNLSFAKLVYNISPENRFLWLSGKIERYIKKYTNTENELRTLLEHLR